MQHKHHNQSGQILIIGMVLGFVLTALSVTLLGYTSVNVKGSRQSVVMNQALQLAEAGIDKAVYELNQDAGYTGESGTSFGDGEFTVTVTDIDSSTKRVTSTGYIPNSSNPVATRVVKSTVYIDTANIAFNFGVQVGAGGLHMNNNSQINGNVFSNGNVTGSGTITGDASVAAGATTVEDTACSVYGADYVFANNDSSNRDIAQQFTPTVNGSLNKVQVYIKKTGSPSNLTVRIMPNTAGGEPSRTGQIGSNGSFSAIGTGYGWIDVSFSSAPVLTAGTPYWIVLDGGSNSAASYYTVGVDSTYGCSGSGKYASNYSSNPPDWQSIIGSNGADINTKTFIGGTTTSLSGVTVNGNARAQVLTSCTIGGDAYFEGASTTCSVSGTQNPSTAAPSPQSLPVSDAQIDDWKSSATNGGVYPSDYLVTGYQTLGPIKIDGDLSFDNGSILNVTGVIWVTGNITFSNNALIRIDSTVTSGGTIIFADGNVTVDNNVTIEGNGNPNTYLLVLSTANSTSAMTVSNNADGAIFYASNGTVNVANNAGGNQLTGYAISMSNNSSVDYSTGLQSATFTTGPGGAWTFRRGSYVIIK
jgi:Tfp pilus assembly protein PilX